MNSDKPTRTAGRKLPLIRILAVIVMVAVAAMLFLQKKQRDLIEVCTFNRGTPEETLAACDKLLNWVLNSPQARSLTYRHRMRVFMAQEDWDAALSEADLAVAADPESPVPWQWKATILTKSGNSRTALGAINEALTLDPDNTYSLEAKHRLLMELEEYDVVDDMISQKWINGEALDWLPFEEMQEITWFPKRFPKSQTAFSKYSSKFRDDLKGDIHNPRLRLRFVASCRLLAANCPPLLPEKRAFYPKIDCDKVVENFERQYAKSVEDALREHGHQTLRDLMKTKRLKVVEIVEAWYLKTAAKLVVDPSPQVSQRFIAEDGMLECLSGGEFVFPSYVFSIDGKNKRDVETPFNQPLRLNLLDLAYVDVD